MWFGTRIVVGRASRAFVEDRSGGGQKTWSGSSPTNAATATATTDPISCGAPVYALMKLNAQPTATSQSREHAVRLNMLRVCARSAERGMRRRYQRRLLVRHRTL